MCASLDERGYGSLVGKVQSCLLFVYLLLLCTRRKLEESNGDIEGDSLPVLLHKTTSQDVSACC